MRAYKKYLVTMALVWAASLVLFVIAFFLFIAPQRKIAAQLNGELTEKQKLYESAVYAANEENKKKLAQEVEAARTQLNRFVVESQESANLTFDISRIAGDKHVSSFAVKTSEQVKSSDQSDSKNLQENRIEVSFASDFRQFAAFLNALERHQPVVFIDRFKLSRGDQGDTNNKVDMELSFLLKKRPEG